MWNIQKYRLQMVVKKHVIFLLGPPVVLLIDIIADETRKTGHESTSVSI